MNIEAIPEVPIMTETWRERKKSNLVKWLMSRFDLIGNTDFAAEIVGCSVQYFNGKLHRDSFSIDDIIALTEATDLTICFLDKNGNPVNKISAYEWFDGYKEDYIQWLNNFKDKQDKFEYDQYLELKRRVDEYEREHNVKGETKNG